jgi:hypothetical protein
MAWTVNDLKAVVKMEKNKDNGPMPSNKQGIVNLYAKCMERKGEDVVIEAPNGPTVMNKNEVDMKTQNDTMQTA